MPKIQAVLAVCFAAMCILLQAVVLVGEGFRPGRGQLAFITSGSWVRGNFGAPLRKFLSANSRMESMVDFGECRQHHAIQIQDTVDYWQGFEQPKIVWPDIRKLPRFSMETENPYLGNPG